MIITGFVLLAGTSVILGIQNKQMNEHAQELREIEAELEKQQEEQKKQQKLNAEIEQMKNDIDHLPDDYTVPGYDEWQQATQVGKYLNDESDGKLKEEWGTFLAIEAEKRDIDPFLVYELLYVETGGTFDPKTVGPQTQYGHAYGLAQFMKNTGPWIADMAELPYEDERLFDPFYSIHLSVVYLEYLYSEYGDWDHALTAYHRGIGGLEDYLDDNGDAKSNYAEEIQDNADENQFVAYDR